MGYKIPHMALIKPKHTSYEENHHSDHPITDHLNQLHQLRETTFKNLWKAQRTSINQSNKKKALQTYKPGDIVIVRNHVRTKMEPFWHDLARIIRKTTNVTYQVEFLNDETKKHNIIHIQHLRLWHSPS
jgi:ribosomal protein L21E